LVEIGQVRAVGRVVTIFSEAILIVVFRLGWYWKVKDEKKKKNGEIHCVLFLSFVLAFEREREREADILIERLFFLFCWFLEGEGEWLIMILSFYLLADEKLKTKLLNMIKQLL
jgi:hypothetical protein